MLLRYIVLLGMLFLFLDDEFLCKETKETYYNHENGHYYYYY